MLYTVLDKKIDQHRNAIKIYYNAQEYERIVMDIRTGKIF